jgi:tetratricopeptide (TPR) repeat protein
MLLAFALSHSRSDETAERLLRRAQAKFPADFWMNFDLANFLLHKKTPDFSEALRYMQAAVALDPHSPVAQNSLGVALGQKGRLEEAIACFVEAIRLKSDYPDAHVSLGVALANKDRLDEAIAKYHDAIRLKKNSPAAYYNLGNALRQKRKPDEAIAAYRETIRLKKDYPGAYINLGVVLGENRRPDEAITEFHKAIEIQPDAHNAYTCLGAALEQKGDLEGAIAAYRQSIRIKEDNPVARINLSVLLAKRGDVDEAITIVREGLRLNPESVDLHDGLGFALRAKGDFDGAIAAFHEAIRLNNKYAGASTNGYTHLGHVLKAKGQFADALASYRRSHELTKAPQWRLQLAKWVKECEHLVELDGKLPRVLEGVLVPGDAAESAEFAAICCTPVKQRYAAAVRFYRDAFAKQPGLADDVQQQHRYNAACAAALAGCGQGKDAAQITEPQRVLWRQQALEWLQSDLEARTALLQKTPQLRDAVQEQLLYWQKDSDLAGVREPAALAKLPQAEQSRWSELWKRVADKRRDLAPPGNPKK